MLSAHRTLRHLLEWPDPTPIACGGGMIMCRIEPDGEMVLCGRQAQGVKSTNVGEEGFLEAFEGLDPQPCRECWCVSLVELNFTFALFPDVGWNLLLRRLYGRNLTK